MSKGEVKLCVDVIDYLIIICFKNTWRINTTEITSKVTLPQNKIINIFLQAQYISTCQESVGISKS